MPAKEPAPAGQQGHKKPLYSKASSPGRCKADVLKAMRDVLPLFTDEAIGILHSYRALELCKDMRLPDNVKRDTMHLVNVVNPFLAFFHLMDVPDDYPDQVHRLVEAILSSCRSMRDNGYSPPISDRQGLYVDMIHDRYFKSSDAFIARAPANKRDVRNIIKDDGRLCLSLTSCGKPKSVTIEWDERLRMLFGFLGRALLDRLGAMPEMNAIWRRSVCGYLKACRDLWDCIYRTWNRLSLGDIPGILQVRLLEDVLIAKDCSWAFDVSSVETIMSAPYTPTSYLAYAKGTIPPMWKNAPRSAKQKMDGSRWWDKECDQRARYMLLALEEGMIADLQKTVVPDAVWGRNRNTLAVHLYMLSATDPWLVFLLNAFLGGFEIGGVTARFLHLSLHQLTEVAACDDFLKLPVPKTLLPKQTWTSAGLFYTTYTEDALDVIPQAVHYGALASLHDAYALVHQGDKDIEAVFPDTARIPSRIRQDFLCKSPSYPQDMIQRIQKYGQAARFMLNTFEQKDATTASGQDIQQPNPTREPGKRAEGQEASKERTRAPPHQKEVPSDHDLNLPDDGNDDLAVNQDPPRSRESNGGWPSTTTGNGDVNGGWSAPVRDNNSYVEPLVDNQPRPEESAGKDGAHKQRAQRTGARRPDADSTTPPTTRPSAVVDTPVATRAIPNNRKRARGDEEEDPATGPRKKSPRQDITDLPVPRSARPARPATPESSLPDDPLPHDSIVQGTTIPSKPRRSQTVDDEDDDEENADRPQELRHSQVKQRSLLGKRGRQTGISAKEGRELKRVRHAQQGHNTDDEESALEEENSTPKTVVAEKDTRRTTRRSLRDKKSTKERSPSQDSDEQSDGTSEDTAHVLTDVLQDRRRRAKDYRAYYKGPSFTELAWIKLTSDDLDSLPVWE
ncbi:hypothetical protein CALVIDRAFT_526764 [Calocera viscosa TUFC12733]|uniref:Uncharacterized protein n=1 Tax=Calocera viscosa (strain TUFC12733) TaxID=1330018 RepID=A0A167NFV7_CALVF|nr:hypothetical protein CALVIDRAFT_526764 [Calocera viscosa TUFC12733]